MQAGDMLGRFRLERLLGKGSYGVVFAAVDTALDAPVAIKVLHEFLAGDAEVRERFRREVVLSRRVTHEAVCRSFDIHHDGDAVFVTMEYVEGETLTQLINRDGRLEPLRAVRALRGIAQGLAAAHAAGVLHRDLKPANVMMRPNGRPVILDFGTATAANIVKVTQPGSTIGSMRFLAPELFEGGEPSELTDVYSLGIVAYTMLAAKLPYPPAANAVAMMEHIRGSPPARLDTIHGDIVPALAAAVARAIATRPEVRTPTAADFDAALAVVEDRLAGAHIVDTGDYSRWAPSAVIREAIAAAPPSDQAATGANGRGAEATAASAPGATASSEATDANERATGSAERARIERAERTWIEDAEHTRIEGAALHTDVDDPTAPHSFSGYRVIRRLGVGGMGEVFLARAESAAGLGRPCVIKTLASKQRVPGRHARLLDEARVAIQLSHRNVCGVTHVGEGESGIYLVMDYIGGRDLEAVLGACRVQGKPVPLPIALYILREVLEGLDYAHRAVDVRSAQPLNIVHRDVSPSNIMLSLEGEVKLIDFGLAVSSVKEERTTAGVVIGKLDYISPEHAIGGRVDARSDVYSLAVVAAELFSGRKYYQGMSVNDQAEHARRGYRSPILDGLDDALQDLLTSALEANPDRRIASAAELRRRIEQEIVDRKAIAGPSDIRAFLLEIFPDEARRQRELLADAMESSGATSLQRVVSLPVQSVGEQRLDDATANAETSVIRPRPRAGPRKIVAIGGALVVVIALVVWVSRGAGDPEAPPQLPIADIAPEPAPTPPVAPLEPLGAMDVPIEPPSQAEARTPPAPGLAPGAGKLRAKPRPAPRTTREKLQLMQQCSEPCAKRVSDAHRRLAQLSVDEARALSAELDLCVKRCR